MDKVELEKYYRAYEDMFLTDGWKAFIEDLEVSAKAIDSIEASNNADDLFFRKGQLASIARVLNLPDSIEVAKQQLIEEETEVA
jgi:hypothetical protein